MLGDEMRRSKLCQLARFALRNHVELDEMKAIASGGLDILTQSPSGPAEASSPAMRFSQSMHASRFNKFQSLSFFSGKFNMSSLSKMLRDIGFCVESADISVIFYHFDVNIDGWIDRDEFINVLQLTGYELDLALDEMKICLTAKVIYRCAPYILNFN